MRLTDQFSCLAGAMAVVIVVAAAAVVVGIVLSRFSSSRPQAKYLGFVSTPYGHTVAKGSNRCYYCTYNLMCGFLCP